jgi:hypothetical protein
MNGDDPGVVEAARAIRPYVNRLLADPDEAAELDKALSELLNNGRRDTPETAQQLRHLLTMHEDTEWFMDEVLADTPLLRPPFHQQRPVHRQPDDMPLLDGDLGPIEADRYSCPDGDYVNWYRSDVGTPVPRCPTHDVKLLRS